MEPTSPSARPNLPRLVVLAVALLGLVLLAARTWTGPAQEDDVHRSPATPEEPGRRPPLADLAAPSNAEAQRSEVGDAPIAPAGESAFGVRGTVRPAPEHGETRAIAWDPNARIHADALARALRDEAVPGIYVAEIDAGGTFILPTPAPATPLRVTIAGGDLYAALAVAVSAPLDDAPSVDLEARRLYGVAFRLVDAASLAPPRCPPNAFDSNSGYGGYGVDTDHVARVSADPLVDLMISEVEASLPDGVELRVLSGAVTNAPQLQLRLDLIGYEPHESRLPMRGLSLAAADVLDVRLRPDAKEWGTFRLRATPAPPELEAEAPAGHEVVLYLKDAEGTSTMYVTRLDGRPVELDIPIGTYGLTVASVHDVTRTPFPVDRGSIEVRAGTAAEATVDLSTTGSIVILPDADLGPRWSMVVQLTREDGSYATASIDQDDHVLFGVQPGRYTLRPTRANGFPLAAETHRIGPVPLMAQGVEFVTVAAH